MRLLDTMVIIGSLDRTSKLHPRCIKYLSSVYEGKETFVPAISILETDLVMKARRYSYEERRISWQALDYKIPINKIVTNSVSSIQAAISLQEKGMDYFDSLIGSSAMEHKATVMTTDRVIGSVVPTEW